MTSGSIETPTENQLSVTEVWLDALARGTCNDGQFLQAVQMLTRSSAEAGWESLSLLDQYYRRGKIKPEVFRRVKAQLGTQLLGPSTELDVSIPLSGRQGSAPVSPRKSPAIVTHTPAADAEAVGAPRATSGAAVPPGAPALTAGAQPTPQARTVPVLTVTSRVSAPAAARPEKAAGLGASREIGPGAVLRGRYVLRAPLGRGGTGSVFEATDNYRLATGDGGQRVALKVLNHQAPNRIDDLRREFQHLQSLTHPNIVRAYEYDRDGDVAFFTMEYLSGMSLGRALSARAPCPLERPYARSIIHDIAAALAHAHAHGTVHGDLNPANIFITDAGELRVLDFGAAPDPLVGAPALEPARDGYTAVAAPRFASCQLLEGGIADARDDIYAFACISYLLLAGRHPFGDRTAVEARDQRQRPTRPPNLSRREWLALRSALAFDRERRPADVASWSKNLQRREAAPQLPPLAALLVTTAPVRRSPRVPLLLLFAVPALIAAVWWGSRHIGSIEGAAGRLASDAGAAIGRFRTEPATPPVASPMAPIESAPAQQSDPSPATPPLRVPAAEAIVHDASLPTKSHSGEMSPITSGAAGAGSRPHIELAADTIDVPLADPAARIVVRRTGSTRGEVSFSWWTEAGTAKPGQDFVLVAPREERIEAGKSSASLFVPVVADATRHRSKSFYVVINNPSADASLGKRTLAMITIPASD